MATRYPYGIIPCMDKIRVYLDNCCYGRPFDDLSQIKVKNEADAKMYIQSLIRYQCLDLYTSFMLTYEVSQCPLENNREHIQQFVNEYSSYHIGENNEPEITSIAKEIVETGIKYKDAVHLACSIFAQCNYFITTDDRISKYKTDKVRIVNPVEFVRIWRDLP